MLMTADKSVLVIIDLQAKLMPAIDQAESVVAKALCLARLARLFGVPVIATEQIPEKLGSNVPEVKALCDQTVVKQHFNACASGLVEALPSGRKQAVVVGSEAHVCALQTALGLIEQGYQVWVVEDAVGSRKERSRQMALARLQQEGARIVTTEMVAFEWAGHAEHAAFREMLALIK